MGIELVLREAVGWLHVLVSLTGLGVCLAQIRRSRWMTLLATGFAIQAAVAVSFRAVALLAGQLGRSTSWLGLVMLVLSGIGLLGSGAIVGGLTAVLFGPDLRSRDTDEAGATAS